jgi:hypothetical protein
VSLALLLSRKFRYEGGWGPVGLMLYYYLADDLFTQIGLFSVAVVLTVTFSVVALHMMATYTSLHFT